VITTGVMNDFSVARKVPPKASKGRWYDAAEFAAGAGGGRGSVNRFRLRTRWTGVGALRLGWAPIHYRHAKRTGLGEVERDMILGGGRDVRGQGQLRAFAAHIEVSRPTRGVAGTA